MIESVSLFEAWALWASGKNVTEQILWGISILWWGRIGKIITLLSALTIVAEVIGPERLRKFGVSLPAGAGFSHARMQLTDGYSWLRLIWRAAKSEWDEDYWGFSRARKEAKRYVVDYINILVTLCITAIALWINRSQLDWWKLLISAFALYWGVLFTIGPLIIASVVIVWAALFAGFDFLVLRPFAWLLERPDLDRLLKLGSAILLLLGFHFDLLAS